MLNEKIKFHRVILIDTEGRRRGEFLRDDAIEIARSEGMDLVLVSPGDPPVCKIMDFGKFQYQQKKKEKTKISHSKLKEIRFTPVIDTRDFEIRIQKAREFLEKGHKVKVTIVMNGRHKKFEDHAYDRAEEFFNSLSDIAQVDSQPQLSGRFLQMILSRR